MVIFPLIWKSRGSSNFYKYENIIKLIVKWGIFSLKLSPDEHEQKFGLMISSNFFIKAWQKNNKELCLGKFWSKYLQD